MLRKIKLKQNWVYEVLMETGGIHRAPMGIWTEDFDFRKRVAHLNQKFAQDGFGALHETIYTQTFALTLKDFIESSFGSPVIPARF